MGCKKGEGVMDTLYYLPALFIIAGGSLWAILNNGFNDNLIQRIALAVICFGAAIRIYVTLFDLGDLPRPRHIILNGVALFVLGTAYKYWRNRNSGDRRKDDD